MFLARLLRAIPQASWLTLYRQRMQAGDTSKAAILFVLNFLRRRKPFCQLTESQAESAAEVLAVLPNPEMFTEVLVQVEASRSIEALTDLQQLRGFVGYCWTKVKS